MDVKVSDVFHGVLFGEPFRYAEKPAVFSPVDLPCLVGVLGFVITITHLTNSQIVG